MHEKQTNVILGVYFEPVPSVFDPPDAAAFYETLGVACVAWRRIEGNFNNILLTVLNTADNPKIGKRFSIKREKAADLWKLAFETTPTLRPLKQTALDFIAKMGELGSFRDMLSHGLWERFDQGQPLGMRVTKVKPRNEVPDGLWHAQTTISVEMLKRYVSEINRLNSVLSSLADILIPLRGAIPQGAIRR
jgi:hypothetical protein